MVSRRRCLVTIVMWHSYADSAVESRDKTAFHETLDTGRKMNVFYVILAGLQLCVDRDIWTLRCWKNCILPEKIFILSWYVYPGLFTLAKWLYHGYFSKIQGQYGSISDDFCFDISSLWWNLRPFRTILHPQSLHHQLGSRTHRQTNGRKGLCDAPRTLK